MRIRVFRRASTKRSHYSCALSLLIIDFCWFERADIEESGSWSHTRPQGNMTVYLYHFCFLAGQSCKSSSSTQTTPSSQGGVDCWLALVQRGFQPLSQQHKNHHVRDAGLQVRLSFRRGFSTVGCQKIMAGDSTNAHEHKVQSGGGLARKIIHIACELSYCLVYWKYHQP